MHFFMTVPIFPIKREKTESNVNRREQGPHPLLA
jgi:hypothetical protein